MELSPVNQVYVNNIKKTSTQVLPDLKPAAQNSNLAQLNQDSIELSSKKPKTDVKKFLLIGASVGTVVAAACTLVKYHNTNKIKNITLLLVCMYLASALFTYIQSICMTNVANKFANNLRNRISTKSS